MAVNLFTSLNMSIQVAPQGIAIFLFKSVSASDKQQINVTVVFHFTRVEN